MVRYVNRLSVLVLIYPYGGSGVLISAVSFIIFQSYCVVSVVYPPIPTVYPHD